MAKQKTRIFKVTQNPGIRLSSTDRGNVSSLYIKCLFHTYFNRHKNSYFIGFFHNHLEFPTKLLLLRGFLPNYLALVL